MPLPSRAELDRLRWAPPPRPADERGHVESFFLKANDPRQPGRALWLKWTLRVPVGAPEAAVAEAWAIRFDGDRRAHQAAKETHHLAACSLAADRLALSIGAAELTPGRARGRVGAGASAIAFALEFDYDGQRPMYAFPRGWMYERGFPKSKLYTSCPATRLSGFIEGAGERWQVDAWPGMLGHNWGRTHAPRYHWAQCSLFTDAAPLVFEGYSGRIRVGRALSPWLTGAVVRVGDDEYPFHALTRLVNPSVRVSPYSWSFTARERGYQLRARVSAREDAFVGLRYENPDGSQSHCLNSKIADCEIELSKKTGVGWRPLARGAGRRSCAYEILTQDFEHAIPVLA
ncbi:MAG: hypothetical protein KC636_36720 [Myxococcales bacterium]|nr:hypothetical protein [Myxococcales bacterium]